MTSNSTNAPVPSIHIFLSQLPSQPPGSKVRFLCCVQYYEVLKGLLHVEHDYPRNGSPFPYAVVDLEHVIESVEQSVLQSGTWLNVIGYVQEPEVKLKQRRRSRTRRDQESIPKVQAILVWDASLVKVEEYERVLDAAITARKDLTFENAV